MGSEGGSDLTEQMGPGDQLDAGCAPPVAEQDFPAQEVETSPRGDVHPLDALRATLDQVAADVTGIKTVFAERVQYDKAKEEAFDRLYRQLDELRAGREFDHLRPLYLDLILLFDRLEQSANEATRHHDVDTVAATLLSLRGELLEVLYRREIELIALSSTKFDPKWQRAIGTQDTTATEQNNTIGMVVRRGFRYRDRLIRPEEVVLNKCPGNKNLPDVPVVW